MTIHKKKLFTVHLNVALNHHAVYDVRVGRARAEQLAHPHVLHGKGWLGWRGRHHREARLRHERSESVLGK